MKQKQNRFYFKIFILKKENIKINYKSKNIYANMNSKGKKIFKILGVRGLGRYQK